MVRPRSCRVIYYFDTPALGRRHQSFGRVIVPHVCTLGDLSFKSFRALRSLGNRMKVINDIHKGKGRDIK